MNTNQRIGILAGVLLLGLAVMAPAATITGSYTAIPSVTSYNLTALGTLDWAYWDVLSNSTITPPAAPTNEKSGGSLISGIGAIGGISGTVRGSTASTKPLGSYSFTDGTSPTSGSVTQATGLFNATLNTLGTGVTVSVMLPAVQTYQIDVWGAAFDATATFQATLPGATAFTNSTLSGPASGVKASALYTLLAKPDTAGDTLTINLTVSALDGADLSHVILSGVAVSAVPTPAALPSGLGLLILMTIRRRRRL